MYNLIETINKPIRIGWKDLSENPSNRIYENKVVYNIKTGKALGGSKESGYSKVHLINENGDTIEPNLSPNSLEINKGTFDSYFDPFAGTESSN